MSRSKDAPMDFEYTSRPSQNSTPAWAHHSSTSSINTPQKRTHATAQSDSQQPPFSSFQTPASQSGTGGGPFLFNTPNTPISVDSNHWQPPASFSPEKAFEVKDIDMADASPPAAHHSPENTTGKRRVAMGAVRRVYRARSQAPKSKSSLALVRTVGESDDEQSEDGEEYEVEGDHPPTAPNYNQYTVNMLGGMMGNSEPVKGVPDVLGGYLHLTLQASLLAAFLFLLYLVLQFVLTLQRDVEARVSEESREILGAISHCTLQYKINNCDSPPPALVGQCAQWELCSSRSPTAVGRGRLVVEILAELVHGFVEGLGWKVLLFTLTSLSFLTLFIHSLLSLGRSRMFTASTPPPPIMQAPHMIMPQTPFRPSKERYLSPAPTTLGRGDNWIENDHNKEPGTPTRRTRRRVDS